MSGCRRCVVVVGIAAAAAAAEKKHARTRSWSFCTMLALIAPPMAQGSCVSLRARSSFMQRLTHMLVQVSDHVLADLKTLDARAKFSRHNTPIQPLKEGSMDDRNPFLLHAFLHRASSS